MLAQANGGDDSGSTSESDDDDSVVSDEIVAVGEEESDDDDIVNVGGRLIHIPRVGVDVARDDVDIDNSDIEAFVASVPLDA